MREKRLLLDKVWYHVETAVNNDEPLFWVARERARFRQVLDEAHTLYAFVLCGLSFCGPWVSFYIKPADGFQLPKIMQWIKQTYSRRFNVFDGRRGHIWGDRYGSKILAGNPPPGAKAYVFVPVACPLNRRVRKLVAGKCGGGPVTGASSVDPATDAKDSPRPGETARKGG